MNTSQTQAPTVDPITFAFLQAQDPSATPDDIKNEMIAMGQMGLLIVAPSAPAPAGITPMTRDQVIAANLKPELFDAGAKFYRLPSAPPSSTTKPSSDPVPWLLAGGGFALVALVAGAALKRAVDSEQVVHQVLPSLRQPLSTRPAWEGGKFYGSRPAWQARGVDDASDMKILWPVNTGTSQETSWEDVNRALDQHPPGTSTLREVTHALRNLGAHFEPWSDGTPGHANNWH